MKKMIILVLLFLAAASVWAEETFIELIVVPGENWIGEGNVGPIKIQVEPSFACWLTGEDGEYMETLYVTGKVASGVWNGTVGRDEVLPVWGHARNVVNEYGLYLPSKTQPLADSVTSPTPMESFSFLCSFPESLEPGKYNVRFEINQSFDFNETWTKGRYNTRNPYRNKVNGQPSLVYEAELIISETGVETGAFTLIGIGSSVGEDGEVYPLDGIDSALNLFEEISIKPTI